MLRVCCCCCYKQSDEYEKILPVNETWEDEVLYDKILSSGLIRFGAIVSFPEGVVQASNFAVDKEGLAAVITALEGNIQTITEGIKLSTELPVYIPGKLDPYKTIYATAIPSPGESDGNGGCTITKVDKWVLIGTYDNNGAAATRLIEESALHIQLKGKVQARR